MFNYSNSLIKTRRYRAFIKMNFSPFLFLWLYQVVFRAMSSFTLPKPLLYIRDLQRIYLEKNLWTFYKKIVYNNTGLLLNNITKSYTFKSINFQVDALSFLNPPRLKLQLKPINYVKHVKVVPVSIQKFFFKKLIMFVLLSLLRLGHSYINYMNFSTSYVYITPNLNLLWIYNKYYFKVHNY